MEYIVIGLGGMGRETAAHVKRLIEEERAKVDAYFIGIDVDPEQPIAANLDEEITISVRNVNSNVPLLLKKPEFREWWVEGYFPPTDIEGNLAANQIRLNGRLAFWFNKERIRERLANALGMVTQARPYVFIISSLGGGTGSGIFLDVAALVRSIKPTAFIYGFFLDGTVTYEIVDKQVAQVDTLMNGYAAITELLYWTMHPKLYKLGDLRIPEVTEELGGTQYTTGKLFDIAFIIQRETEKDYRFTESDVTILKRNFFNLIANTIYPMIGVRDFQASYIGDTFQQRFGGLQGEHRELAFASTGVGRITFDKYKVCNYISTYLIEKLLKEEKREIKPGFDKIEDSLGIKEREDRALTNNIRQDSKWYRGFRESLYSVTRRIMDNLTNDGVLKNLAVSYPIITREDMLPQFFVDFFGDEGYGKEWQTALIAKEAKVIEEIEKIINDHVRKEGCASLIEWLTGAKGMLMKNKDYVEKIREKYNVPESLRRVCRTWKELLQTKATGIFGRPNPKRMQIASRYIKCLEEYIEARITTQVEVPLLMGFFDRLIKFIDLKIDVMRFFQRKFEKIKDEAIRRRSTITERDVPLDEYRLRNREYPLEVKIDLKLELIDKYIKDEIVKELSGKIENYRERLYNEVVKRFMETVEKMIVENRIRELYDSETMEEECEKLFDKTIREDIIVKLARYKIDDMLRWWLREQLYPQVKNYLEKGMREELNQLAQKWRIIFGDSIDALTDPNSDVLREQDETKRQKRWVEEALFAFMREFKGYIAPFAKITKEMYRQRKELHGKGKEDDYINVIYTPVGFDEKLLKGERIQATQLTSPSLWIYSQINLVSPYSLELYRYLEGINIEAKYREHRSRFGKCIRNREPLPGQPYHIDKRFYTDWRVEISAPEEEKLASIYWLYVVGLGVGLIKRATYKGGKKKVFLFEKEGQKKLGDTLPKMINTLQVDEELRSSIKRAIWEALEEVYIKNDRDYRKLENEVFKKACEIHRQFKGAGGEHWQRIFEMIEYDVTGERGVENRVPNSWEELKALWERI